MLKLPRLVVLIYKTILVLTLLNDDVFVQVIVSSIRTNRARCALYKKNVDLLDKESISGESSGRDRECLKS